MSDPLVRTAWDRIESWCRANDPQSLQELNPGASVEDLGALEAAIKHSPSGGCSHIAFDPQRADLKIA